MKMLECGPANTAAYRRYLKRFIPATIAYVLAIALATWFLPNDAQASPLSIAIAILPGIAVLIWLWAMARLLTELDDEYLRLLEVKKALVATGFTLTICSVWGILELFTDVPRLPVFFVFPLWCLGLSVGQLWNRVSGA